MKFLSDILAKAGLTVDGVVTLNNTATGQTPDANDNSTKLATTAWVRTFVQPYSLPIASASILGGVKVGSGLSINSSTGVLSVVGASAASIKSTQTFVVTEGQTVFTVTGGYTPGLIDIFLNGVYLSPNQTVATNGTTFTINDPAAAGDIVDVIVASAIFEGSASTTDQLPEGSINLYYTNTRARAAITLTTTGVSGAATYNSSTGVFNIPNYQGLVPAGGVAGDILAKVSGTNYDVTWIPNYTSTVQHTVKAAVAVTKGQAVYVSSADGTNMIVSKASNASEGTSSKTLGLVAQDLAINGQGFVVTEGLLAGLNTSTAQAGDPVWLGTNGNLIFGLLNKPTAPAHLVFIGIVTRVQSNNGEIFVKVQNGFELDELHDLSVKNPTDGDMIKYIASTGLWTKIAATTTNITEGTNLYYTQARFDTAFAAKSTTNLAEGTNLYYTNARARAAISVTGSGSYDSATGVITVTGGVTSVNTLTGAVTLTTTNIGEGTNLYYTTARVNSDFDTRLATKSTTNLAEGTNLYYTTARVNSDFDTRLATKSTTNLAEGTNLYYTDARVGTYLTNNSYATQSYVSTQINNLVSGAPGLLDTLDELAAALGDDPNFATTVSTALSNRLRIDINNQGLTSTQQGNGRTNLGLGSLAVLSSVANAQITDLAYSKLTGVPSTFTPSAHTHPISDITGLQTALDGKQASLSGTGFVKINGSTISYDNSTYYLASNPNGYITSSALSSYLPLSGGTLTGQLVVAYNSGTEPYVNAIFRAVGGANIGGVLVNGTVQSHIRFLVGSDTWGGTGAKQWQIRVGNGNTEDNLKIYSWTKGSDTMTILNNGDTTIHGNLSASNLSGTNTGDQTLNSLGALSSNFDSEQAVGVRNLYYNDGVKRVSSDPRWNESGYDTDLGTLHIYSTTAAGVNYGRAGIALYNGSAYQYITTQSGQSNIYINNNVALHAGNYSSYSLPLSGGTLTGQMFISPSAGVNAWLRVNRSSTSGEAGVQMRTNGVDDWYVGTRSADGVSSYHFYSYTTNTSVAQITSAGSLNIGNTTNTAYKLYVNGTAYINNTFWANDNIVMRGGEFYYGGQTTDRFLRTYHSGTAGSGILNYQFFDGTNWITRKTFDANGVATYTGNSTTLKINTTSRVLEVTGKDNYYPVHIFGGSGVNTSYGLLVQAGTSTSDRSFVVVNRADNADYFSVNGGGQVVIGPGTASNARFAVSAPNSHFSFGNNVGATFNISPASTGQGGVDLNASYWTGTGYPYVNFTVGGNNAFRITPSKEFWFWAEDNSVARANIYYSNATNEYRVYATNSSGGTIGVKLMEYNGSTYYQVLTTNTGLALTGGTLSGGLTANARIQNFVDIGPDDNVRTGLVAYDTRAMAAGVGGQLVLGYKYTSAGDYTEGAIIKMYKVNGTSGDFSSGIKFQARVSGNNLSTLMTLDHYGRLGIGISPTEKLDVRGNFLLKGDATDGGILTITRRYSTGQQTINFNNNHPNTNLDWTGARIVSADAGNYNGYLDFQVSLGNNSNEAAGTAAVATVMRLTKDARLGLGTLTPGYKFHLVGGSEVGSRFIVSGTYAPIQFSGDSGGTLGAVNAYSDHIAIGRGTSTGITADISIQASTGKVSIGYSSPLYVSDKLLTINGPWRANITSGGLDRCEIRDTNGSQIDLVAYVAGGEAYSNSIGMFVNGGKDALIMAGNANIRFVTGGYTEVARCTNSQEFLVGYTSDQGAYKLQVNGAIYASSDITAFSDVSVKENIRTINNALERVTKSRGVVYDRIDTNSKDNIGFIAQELEVEFPELISTNADGTKGVKYQNMVAVLIEAVKEQQVQIESQKSEIEELKDLVKQLINR